MADLITYQQQSNNIYDPQLIAEQQQIDANNRSAKANFDLEQKTVEPTYQQAIQNLNSQVESESGKINQLYSQRLGGQFSGLQGNDTGMMYSKANQQRTSIETARANKLADIATRRTNQQDQYNTAISSLQSKYRGIKAQYAQNAYDTAVREEQAAAREAAREAADQANRNAELAMRQAELRARSSRSTPASSNKPTPEDIVSYFQSAQSQYGDYNRNSTNYHRWQAAEDALLQNGYDPSKYKKLTTSVFGSPAERAAAGV